MDYKKSLNQLLARQNLSDEQMTGMMQALMTGELSPAQIAGFLVALRMKGETVVEIVAAAKVMRSLASGVTVNLPYMVDTCGTGGDGLSTFNISTTVSFVAAAAGANVAKHGNRSVSSASGSADVLKAAGVNIELQSKEVARCIEALGVGFMFAPMHHSAMKHAIGPRRELGVYTLFNLLGPLTNPAKVPNQVMGVFSKEWLRPLAEVLKTLGSRHVMLVHAEVGLDEISPEGVTHVAELKEGDINEFCVSPADFDLSSGELEDIWVSGQEASLAMMQSVLSAEPSTALTTVLLNAGAAIYVSGIAKSLKEGIHMAQDAIDSGLAKEKLKEYRQMTQLIRESDLRESD